MKADGSLVDSEPNWVTGRRFTPTRDTPTSLPISLTLVCAAVGNLNLFNAVTRSANGNMD